MLWSVSTFPDPVRLAICLTLALAALYVVLDLVRHHHPR